MFRILRYCYSFVVAGLIGMLAGMVGQIYNRHIYTVRQEMGVALRRQQRAAQYHDHQLGRYGYSVG